ncbi:MAG TPA: hypothetical protein EYQ86_08670 [Bacteroidetes bacterium]|nr:hypothetical protein [Bacteroidota bacterium]
MKQNIFILLVILLIISTSCNKDDTNPPNPPTTPPPTNTQLLTGESWMRTAMTIDTAILPDSTNTSLNSNDLYPFIDACEHDNIIHFSSNSTFVYEEGSSKCNTSDPDTIASGAWVFNSNETKIITTPGNLHFSTDIVSLDSLNLIVKYDSAFATSSSGGIPDTLWIVVTETYSHP